MNYERDAMQVSAAQRAYGILWRERTTSPHAKTARKELFDDLSHEERRAGIAWAMEMFGPMTDAEMIADDIRVGAFQNKSTEPMPRISNDLEPKPFFLTRWEREDYEREQRGQKPLGPR